MIAVIIAGGSGTRLWPLSTPDYPKHLLKLNGDQHSLVQSTYDRARRLADTIYVVTEAGHVHHVQEQLPDLAEEMFIIEPARRGTASCVVAALVHVAQHNDPDEPIAILSADHYIRDVKGFEHSFKIASRMSHEHNRIVQVGIEPYYPATGFGYIEKGELVDEQSFTFSVRSFREKPDHETALAYVTSGNYLWNCGYYVGSVNTFKEVMQASGSHMAADYEKLAAATPETYKDVYLGFENISIDYALIEKVPNLLVVPASFDWMDLGSFGDLHKVVGRNHEGNHVQGNVELEAVQNSLIHNHEDKPVAVIGLNNIVVINTPQGLLVARKDMSQKVGDVSKRFSN